MLLRRIAITLVVIWNIVAAGYISFGVIYFIGVPRSRNVSDLWVLGILASVWLIGNILFSVMAVFIVMFRHSVNCQNCASIEKSDT